MPPAHFIADRDFALLGDINADLLIDARSHFVVVLARKDIDGNDFAAFAVRNAQGSIADFASLFTKDSAEQPFFRRKFGFAFRGDFTDENITGTDIRADSDNAFRIKMS